MLAADSGKGLLINLCLFKKASSSASEGQYKDGNPTPLSTKLKQIELCR